MMDQRPFDTEFDRWLSASLTARPEVAPIPGLADRVRLRASNRALASGNARRLARQRLRLWWANLAAALAIAATIWFAAPTAWRQYQATTAAWTAEVAASGAVLAVANESTATGSEDLLWPVSAALLAVILGLAVAELLNSGRELRPVAFVLER
jgi:hypothetical protein